MKNLKNFNAKNLIARFFIAFALFSTLSVAALANSTADNTATTNMTAGSDWYWNNFRVNARRNHVHTFGFYKHERVYIRISGDGDTNLDLYVYDSAGRLITYSTGSSDQEGIIMNVNRDDDFRIYVVNRGSVYNDYELSYQIY